MKYEPVFGDQSLFDGAGLFTGIDIVTRSVDDGLYITSRLSDETSTSIKKNPIVAMRRIITEPKRWTWEDQKAGRLPEVGWAVTTYDTKRYVFVGESCHENQWSLRDAESGKVYHTPITWVLPLETPEEKAARLKECWGARAAELFARADDGAAFDFIYDAILSGELPVPVKGE